MCDDGDNGGGNGETRESRSETVVLSVMRFEMQTMSMVRSEGRWSLRWWVRLVVVVREGKEREKRG